MSTNVKKFVPDITEKLNYATADIYLLQQGVLTVAEFESFQKALQNGSLGNGDVVRKLLPKILEKPRDFYRALRQHIQDNYNVHAGNMELFHMLPYNFGKGIIKSAFGMLRPSQKNKSPISTIVEDPVSSSDTDKYLDQSQVRTPSPTEGHVSSDEESYYETHSLGAYNRRLEFGSTQSLYTPRRKRKRQPSERSYPQQSTTSQQTLTSSNHHSTRRRSASVNENHLVCNMKAHSLSELNQTNIATDDYPIKVEVNDSYLSLQSKIHDNNLQIEKLKIKYESLQSEVNELKQQQPGYNHNDVEIYKTQLKTEKEKATKAQQDFIHASNELQKKDLALRKAQDDLVKKSKDAEKENKEALRLLHEKQQLEDDLKQCNVHIKKLTETLQKNESDIQRLQDENNMLNRQLENIKKFENQDQNAELTEHKKQYSILEERFLEVQSEKQNMELVIKRLQNDIVRYQNKHKSEVESLERKLQKLEDHQATNVQEQTPAPEVEKTTKDKTTTQVESSPVVGDQFMKPEKQPTNNHNTEVTEKANLQKDRDVPPKQPPSNDVPGKEVNRKSTTLDRRSLGSSLPPKPSLPTRSSSKTIERMPSMPEVTEKANLHEDRDVPPKQPPSNDVPGKEVNRKSTTLDRRPLGSSLPPKPSLPTRSSSKTIERTPSMPPPSSPQPPPRSGQTSKTDPSKILQWWKIEWHVIPKIMDHWKDVALHSLCFDTSTIAEIEKRGKNNPKHCCTILFKDWLETNKSVTREILLTQLSKVEKLGDKIEEIKKQLK